MNSTNPNDVILSKAWNMLWDKSSKFYLPTILENGGDFGGEHIPPLQSVDLDDLKKIPLYQSKTWGNVDITLSSIVLSGIPQVSSNGFTPDSADGKISGGIAFSLLDIKGAYEVIGSGLVGCAMDLAQSSAESGPMPPPVEEEEFPLLGDAQPANLDLARDYRDQLINQGNNGATLVSTYYDQNDTMNTILNDHNAFTAAWPIAVPPGSGGNTKYYMGVTNVAGQNPNDPVYTVGGSAYNSHSYYMQTLLLGVAKNMANGSKDPENPYYALEQSITDFKSNTLPNDGSSTVDTVMTTVKTATPIIPSQGGENLEEVVEHEVARKAREAAEKDFDMWQKKAEAAKAATVAAVTTYKSSGNFDFSFPMPTIAFDGTVKVSGISPNITMTTAVTKLTAAIPDVNINLLSGTDPSFTADAQSKIHDAVWFQQTIGVKVNAALNTQSLLGKISGVMNQALKTLLPNS